jgi:metallophosphoesterase (TIGR00282 family)
MPSNRPINILFIGDIIGRQGRLAVEHLLPGLKEQFEVDFTVANGENAAGGFGITRKLAEELTDLGVDAFTSGNHIWDRREVVGDLDSMPNVLRPLNYPPGVPGRGWGNFETRDGTRISLINLSGRVFMQALDCPFRAVDAVLAQGQKVITVVDVHAEATSEKIAMGWYLDGRVSAVIGTHTHVQTADERVLPGGTAYITDAGMTGPFDSVIGVDKTAIIHRFLTGIPNRFDSAAGDVRLCGAVISVDCQTRKAVAIRRVNAPVETGGADEGQAA